MIDILITVYNSFVYAAYCVETLLINNEQEINSIILADGCSPDRMKDYEPSGEKIKILRSSKRLYFSQNVNFGFSAVTTEFFILLNADTYVTDPAWIPKLFEWYVKVDKPGILSPWGANYEEPLPTNRTEARESRRIGAFAWFLKSDLFRNLGGLREDGDYIHWHSDFEFCDRVYKYGLKNYWIPTTIAHKGGGSGPIDGIKEKREKRKVMKER